jgi:hypothetical protein
MCSVMQQAERVPPRSCLYLDTGNGISNYFHRIQRKLRAIIRFQMCDWLVSKSVTSHIELWQTKCGPRPAVNFLQPLFLAKIYNRYEVIQTQKTTQQSDPSNLLYLWEQYKVLSSHYLLRTTPKVCMQKVKQTAGRPDQSS